MIEKKIWVKGKYLYLPEGQELANDNEIAISNLNEKIFNSFKN